jgi:SNF2 family DNA or RNA helicase
MNFLDPEKWTDLEALAKEHEELTEDLVKQLHNRLRPYFLRRIKSEVLRLPPKVRSSSRDSLNILWALCQNEVIVPLSMAPLQKEIYRSILSEYFQFQSDSCYTIFRSQLGALERCNSVIDIKCCYRGNEGTYQQCPYAIAKVRDSSIHIPHFII